MVRSRSAFRGSGERESAILARLCAGICATVAMPLALAFAQDASRLERLNASFLRHLETLGVEHAAAVEIVRQGWEQTYRQNAPESFVPEALVVLYPGFGAGLAAFDEDRSADAVRLLEPLLNDADPYVSANAAYFCARALVEQRMFEEAQALSDATRPVLTELAGYTPYAAHLLLLRAYCQARNLQPAAAAESLTQLREAFPDAVEPVQMGARQLALQLERREEGTLDEAASLMAYAADRLHASDSGPRVQERQEQTVALLDKLIEETRQLEQQQGRGGRGRRGGKGGSGRPAGSPQSPLEESAAPGGPGRIGELHAGAKALPGEMWGRLPPAERERILQSLQERFPSRYRQLVEQYYRALAEEK